MSVFTFDPDPPRVASPWLRPVKLGEKVRHSPPSAFGSGLLSDYGLTKLEAEPQDGPTEYKLHLLLRPRRAYRSMSTTTLVSGSTQSRPPHEPKQSQKPAPATAAAASPGPSSQTRQTRLEHLTTQLLWRLQQSCPYHAASKSAQLVIPKLPDENVGLNAGLAKTGKLLPGLEVSRGALYEIGVADDGALVGLTRDELDESLVTLEIMASSLGCNLKVMRTVEVGRCEWVDAGDPDTDPNTTLVPASALAASLDGPEVHREKLLVAEALVTPNLGSRDTDPDSESHETHLSPRPAGTLPEPKYAPLTAHQVRVTLTGPTTSGKSTLLGTLSTGTLDNGHGKSRLSLLKHRHEVASGVTSSVAQELIGYNHDSIFNYSHASIESWIDIHDFTKGGRLAFLLDSAGHPRYRRTILRGIVGWAPDWTLLCIAADDLEPSVGPGAGAGATSSAEEILGAAGAGVDLAQAHLDLCLDLELPLVVVITKFDLATKSSLHRRLSKILTAIKATGRTPKILQRDQPGNEGLTEVPPNDAESAQAVVRSIEQAESLQSIVPIVFTSAVKGTGVGLIHALLQSLPLPPLPTSSDYIGPALNPEQPACLFHIEDRFSLPASYGSLAPTVDQPADSGTVVAGYLRFGRLSLGDVVLIGPFPPDEDDARGGFTPEDRPSPGNYGLSISNPSSTELSKIATTRNSVPASTIHGEWHSATIVSIRNLRLPVRTLGPGQVGSVGIVFDPREEKHPCDNDDGDGDGDGFGFSEPRVPSIPKLRKGMVLAIPSKHMVDTGLSLQAASGLTAAFPSMDPASLTVGSLVNIYAASVRAAARVVSVSRGVGLQGGPGSTATEEIDDVFHLSEHIETDNAETLPGTGAEVQLELLTNREWIELGSRILILEGGCRDKSGLEGFVGKVIEIVD